MAKKEEVGLFEAEREKDPRGNKPLQDRMLELNAEIKEIKAGFRELVAAMKEKKRDETKEDMILKLYDEEKRARQALTDQVLQRLDDRSQESTGSFGGGSLEQLIALVEDDKIGPIIKRLLGADQGPDWEKIVDKVLDRLQPAQMPIRVGAARPIAEEAIKEVVAVPVVEVPK